MITIKDKKDCCGCTACYNACPKKAIAMQADQEGFLYPVIDQKKCVDCGICDATCPIINKVEKNPEQTKGFILRIPNGYQPKKNCCQTDGSFSFSASIQEVIKS